MLHCTVAGCRHCWRSSRDRRYRRGLEEGIPVGKRWSWLLVVVSGRRMQRGRHARRRHSRGRLCLARKEDVMLIGRRDIAGKVRK